MQSVSGGGHWGGGFQISTRDHARFGYLFLRRGRWNAEQLISEKWIDMMTVPTPIKPTYGYMWWLNQGERSYPDAPEDIYYAAGFGGNYIFVDKQHNVVVVTRWLNPPVMGEFMTKMMDAFE